MHRQIQLTAMQARLIGATVSVFFLALGLFLFLRSATDTSKWPTAKGKIIDGQIGSFGQGSSDNFWLRVKYEYVVSGARYEGDRRNLIDRPVRTSFSRRQLEEERRSGWRDGAEVVVYYDPRNPDRSVLETAPIHWTRKGGILCMVACGALGLFASLFGKLKS